MGMVGGGHCKGNGSSSRGRPYALMLLIAFGAALLGVFVLHKFRERRICNLLLKQKDQDLFSLQLLFQKQRDRNNEWEKNIEDMKAALYSARTQKMELERRLLEMQSTIDSLRDEQKTIDVALQEKQNELKMLRDRETETRKEIIPQVASLTETLEQKEAELVDLKHRLESRVKARSEVVDDDPSNPQMSVELNISSLKLNDSLDDDRMERKSAEEENSKRVEIETQNPVEDHENEIGKGVLDDDARNESVIAQDNKEEEVKGSQELENQKPNGVMKNGIKMEPETGKSKGKRWRYIAKKRKLDNRWRLKSKHRKLENNRHLDDIIITSMRSRKLLPDGEAFSGEDMKEYPIEATTSMDSSNVHFVKHQPKTMGEEDEEKQIENEDKMLMISNEFNSTKSGVLEERDEQKQDDEQTRKRDAQDRSMEQNPEEEVDVDPNGLKSEERRETEQDAAGHLGEESSSDDNEDKEEYKEQRDEPEF